MLYAPTFVPPILIPVRMGGMAFSGHFVKDGTWTRLSEVTYGSRFGPTKSYGS